MTASRQFSASCMGFQCGNVSSSRLPPWSTRAPGWQCCLLTDISPRRLHFLSVRHAPTSLIEPSVQLDLVFGTVFRWTLDIQACYAANLESHGWKTLHFYLGSGTRALWPTSLSPLNSTLKTLVFTYTCLIYFIYHLVSWLRFVWVWPNQGLLVFIVFSEFSCLDLLTKWRQ